MKMDRLLSQIFQSGKIEYSDHYKFLEDTRVYKARCVAFGTPKDNTSFYLYDITGLNEAAMPTRARKEKAKAEGENSVSQK